MKTAIRITFDSNVWRPLVSPLIFPNDPDTSHFQLIRHSIEQKLASGYLSETVFTLEAIQRVNRKPFFGASKLKSKSTIEEQKDGQIRFGMVFGPDPSHHATNSPHLTNHLQDARALGFKLLKCPRIGGIGNPNLLASDYAADDRISVSDRLDRTAKCARDIEAQGWGIKHIKDIGNKYSGGKPWLNGLIAAPENEKGVIANAIAEWADGDSIAGHYGYGNDYFCTRDEAKAAGAASVLSLSNQAWLAQKYKIQIVSPEALAKIVSNHETT